MNKNLKHRQIAFYKNYFQDFFDKQSEKAKAKIPRVFMDAYPDSIANIINRTNYMEFVNI